MRRYRGFSFAEVMFAVVILGVGFIMVASVFPVAAEQTRTTNDQSVAAQLARDAINTIASSTNVEDYTGSAGTVQAFSQASLSKLWEKVSASMICASDQRYACVPFYCTPSNATDPVLVTVLVVRRWAHDGYSYVDQSSNAKGQEGDLCPRGITINQILRQGDGTQLVQIARDTTLTYQSVASGTFMVITSGGANIAGHVLQIGQYVGESEQASLWTLAPGSNMGADESCNDVAKASVIGRDFEDINNPTTYSGPAQDIAVFKSYISPR